MYHHIHSVFKVRAIFIYLQRGSASIFMVKRVYMKFAAYIRPTGDHRSS